MRLFARYARRATAALARAGIRRATVIGRQCRGMSEYRDDRGGEGIIPHPIEIQDNKKEAESI